MNGSALAQSGANVPPTTLRIAAMLVQTVVEIVGGMDTSPTNVERGKMGNLMNHPRKSRKTKCQMRGRKSW